VRWTCYLSQAPQVFKVKVERFLGDTDAKPVSMKNATTFEFSGQVVGDSLDVDLVLLLGHRIDILGSQVSKQAP
jgi:hypothetical protein